MSNKMLPRTFRGMLSREYSLAYLARYTDYDEAYLWCVADGRKGLTLEGARRIAEVRASCPERFECGNGHTAGAFYAKLVEAMMYDAEMALLLRNEATQVLLLDPAIEVVDASGRKVTAEEIAKTKDR